MNDSKIKRWLSVLLVTASSMVMSAGDPSSCSWGEADGALRIGVMAGVDGIDKTSEISVCFENVSREGIAINLGIILANGSTQYPTALELVWLDGAGKIHTFNCALPAGVAGRVDPFVILLPAGAVYQLPFPLKRIVQDNAKVWPGALRPGQYKLTVNFVGKAVSKQDTNSDMTGLAFMPYWTGQARSGEIAIQIP